MVNFSVNNNNNIGPSDRSNFLVQSSNVKYTQDYIWTEYVYRDSVVQRQPDKSLVVVPTEEIYHFKVNRHVPKTGLMMVGWGGNNGSTVTASIIANRENMKWKTKIGVQHANYYGSLTQASTVRLGKDKNGNDLYVPFSSMLPMVNPNNLIVGGWDICSDNLAIAMEKAGVLEPDLQSQLWNEMSKHQPLPSVYEPDFIAANQNDRATNLIQGPKSKQLEKIRQDIRDFKSSNDLDKVVVVWTANTERYADIIEGVNDTSENILKAIQNNHGEISPSSLFAVASILEGCTFINGSPQNTFVPGVIQLAEIRQVHVAGDDFKSGQTKFKSVLVDFLVSAGIKPLAITSYNHLGNNDGKNLSAPQQFRSKEISKSNVVDDMVESNSILYKKGEHPDHTIVIKYCPSVGDSKRAMDEYVSEIFMGGKSVVSLYNVCEDSLLAAPLILDLVILGELMSRIEFKNETMTTYQQFHPVLSILSYLLKAPVVPENAQVVNSLAKQRASIVNVLRACIGLPPQHDMLLEQKAFLPAVHC